MGTVAAYLYWIFGLSAAVGGVAVAPGDMRGGIKLGVSGIVVAGCGLSLYVWGRLRDQTAPLTRGKALFLLLPTVLFALAVILDPYGIVSKAFGYDILGYWK